MSKENIDEETLETYALRANLIGTAVLILSLIKDLLNFFITSVWLNRLIGGFVLGVILVIIRKLKPSTINSINSSEKIREITRKKCFETVTVFSAVLYGAENWLDLRTFISMFEHSIYNVIWFLLGVIFAIAVIIYWRRNR